MRIGWVMVVLHIAVLCYGQQRLSKPDMWLGLQGGVMFSSVFFNPEVLMMEHFYDAYILGGNGGLVFRYNGNKVCGFQIELNYMQRGWREYGQDTAGNVNYRRHLHYIELPFLTHIYLGKNRCFFMFNLGPQVGICVKERSFGTRSTVVTHQYDKITHPFDWGVAGGVGVIYKNRREDILQLELRFGYSFGYLYENSITSFFSASNPITFSANLGWLWSIRKKNEKKTN